MEENMDCICLKQWKQVTDASFRIFFFFNFHIQCSGTNVKFYLQLVLNYSSQRG